MIHGRQPGMIMEARARTACDSCDARSSDCSTTREQAQDHTHATRPCSPTESHRVKQVQQSMPHSQPPLTPWPELRPLRQARHSGEGLVSAITLRASPFQGFRQLQSSHGGGEAPGVRPVVGTRQAQPCSRIVRLGGGIRNHVARVCRRHLQCAATIQPVVTTMNSHAP